MRHRFLPITLLIVALCSPGNALARERGPGSLFIESEPPRALVRVDGLKIGRTPIRGHKLPAGAHRIELSHAILGAKRSFQVVVAPGKSTRLKVDLNR